MSTTEKMKIQRFDEVAAKHFSDQFCETVQ